MVAISLTAGSTTVAFSDPYVAYIEITAILLKGR